MVMVKNNQLKILKK